MTNTWWTPVTFGKTGLDVSRLAIGSSYGVGGRDLERAHERGINFFFWGLRRREQFAEGVRAISAKGRERICIAIQSYSRSALLMTPFVESALRRLRTDYVDILTLGWWNVVPPRRIVDKALALQASGKVRQLMISCHDRPRFQELIPDDRFSSIMVRYNAAHPGAETEVFPFLPREGPAPGVLGFTATRWGSLLRPELGPRDERTPSATDCYRFVLSNPHVHVSLAGPKDGAELDAAFEALDAGPLSEDELAWLRRVGASVRARAKGNSPVTAIDWIEAIFRRRPRPHALPAPR